MGSTGGGLQSALNMLSLFESVKIFTFELTITSLEGKKVRFSPGQKIDALRRSLPRLLDQADRNRWNLILRPRPPKDLTLIQLDDLDADALARVTPLSLLTIETSQANYQAWIAVNGVLSPELVRQVKIHAFADLSASGATRLAGSRNFKPAYAPNFPVVTLKQIFPGRTTSEDELRSSGLLIAKSGPVAIHTHPAPARASSVTPDHRSAIARARRPSGPKQWPDYRRYLDNAPPAHRSSDRPDISRVDFAYSLDALRRGFTTLEIAAKLLQESPKARTEGKAYAERTARRAEIIGRERT